MPKLETGQDVPFELLCQLRTPPEDEWKEKNLDVVSEQFCFFFLFLREGCSEGGRGIDNFRQGTVHHRSARTGNQTSRHTVEFNLLFFLIVPISFATKNASTVDKCVWMIVILTTNPSITLTPQGSKVLGEKVKGPICACTTYKKRVGEP